MKFEHGHGPGSMVVLENVMETRDSRQMKKIVEMVMTGGQSMPRLGAISRV